MNKETLSQKIKWILLSFSGTGNYANMPNAIIVPKLANGTGGHFFDSFRRRNNHAFS